jgi:GxxExxY protein
MHADIVSADSRCAEDGRRRILHAALTERILGVFFDVYNELGPGFLESVYQQAMALALTDAGLTVEREAVIDVRFRDRTIGSFRADLVVQGLVMLELKSVRAVEDAHERQLLNYLRATTLEVGLLVNFGPRPTFRRFVFRNERKRGSGIRADPR